MCVENSLGVTVGTFRDIYPFCYIQALDEFMYAIRALAFYEAF